MAFELVNKVPLKRFGLQRHPHHLFSPDKNVKRPCDVHNSSLFFPVIIPNNELHEIAFWCKIRIPKESNSFAIVIKAARKRGAMKENPRKIPSFLLHTAKRNRQKKKKKRKEIRNN